MSLTVRARAHCNALRCLWLEASENDRDVISAEIALLTQRGTYASLTEMAQRAFDEDKSDG